MEAAPQRVALPTRETPPPGTPISVRLRARLRRFAPPLIFALLVLGIWQLYCTVSSIPESSLPAPTEIFSALITERALLAENAWVTIQEIAIGYLAAIILGVGLAVLICSSKMIERAVYPWLVVSQMVPIVAIAPIIVIWTGFDLRPKIIVIALVSFFPIAVNTIDGKSAEDIWRQALGALQDGAVPSRAAVHLLRPADRRCTLRHRRGIRRMGRFIRGTRLPNPDLQQPDLDDRDVRCRDCPCLHWASAIRARRPASAPYDPLVRRRAVR